MNEAQIAGMADELEKIKEAGWGSLLAGAKKFLGGGVKGFKALGSQAGRAGLLQQAKNLPGRLSTAWQHGGWQGAGKALLRSQPVQMAAMGAGGLYAGKKLLGRDRQQ